LPSNLTRRQTQRKAIGQALLLPLSKAHKPTQSGDFILKAAKDLPGSLPPACTLALFILHENTHHMPKRNWRKGKAAEKPLTRQTRLRRRGQETPAKKR